MKYSVVIPLYNKEHFIKKAIQSVLTQSFQDFEIIVVDDGSTDRSLEIAREIRSEKLKVYAQLNQGVSAARNKGIENASGEYIAFLDADDTWNMDYLETIDELTTAYPESDMYVTAYAVHMGNGKVNYSRQLPEKKGCLKSYWLTLKKGYDFVWTSVTTVRREALMHAGCFRPGEKIGQDLDMWARLARNNPKVAYSSKICANYNRAAEHNARTRVKIAWAKAFIHDLEEELENSSHTPEEIQAIQSKYDKKMTVYIFTAIMAGEKKRAMKALKGWKGKRNLQNSMLRVGLSIAGILPTFIHQWIYNIRLKVF